MKLNFIEKLKSEKLITLMSLLGMLYLLFSGFFIAPSVYQEGSDSIRILYVGKGDLFGLEEYLYFRTDRKSVV